MFRRETLMERLTVPMTGLNSAVRSVWSLAWMMVPTTVEAMVRYWEMLMDFRKVLPMARLSDQGWVLKMETSTDPMKDSRLATSTVRYSAMC